MSAAWVAASVRARAMTRRRLGRAGARDLAQCPNLTSAVAVLAGSPYGDDLRLGATLDEAQRAVVATVVLERPRAGRMGTTRGSHDSARALRRCRGPQRDGPSRGLLGGAAPEPFRLGALATAWPRLSTTRTPEALRRAWRPRRGEIPGGASPQEVGPP